MPEKIDQINKLIKALPLPKKELYKLKPGANTEDFDVLVKSKTQDKIYLVDQEDLLVSGENGTVITDGTTIIGDGLNTPLSAIFNQEGKYIISGGSAWSGVGWVFDVSIIDYFFNGLKSTVQTTVTLDASDVTYNRFDAIVVDEDGVVSVIKGTAEANPITPTILENQLLVQYVLVGAGTLTPAITQEIVHSDEPTTNWTASNYTTAGGVVGTTDFTATTPTPFQGADCILNTRDGRTGVRFVRDTAINLAGYTYVALRVFIPTVLATNKSLVLRFENSAGVLIGTGINLFSYGINRNLIGVWQMAYVPTYAFGAINSIKGLKIILSGGTVGVTAQWAIDYVLLSTGSTPSANLPTITVSENGVAKGTTSNVDFIDGTGTTVDVVKDNVSGKIDVKVNALGGSSALFPNGAEVITTSGEYQSSYAGKLLVLEAGVELTMPLVNPLPTCNVGVVSFVEESEGRGKFNIENGAGLIKPAVDEVITILSFAGNNTLGLTAPVRNDGVSGEVTLYEKLENTLGGGGGGDIFITKTIAEIDTLISTNALVKGATYKITGVHPTLYNDGSNSGTTILLKAISENVLETQGTGIFYNPKYNQAVDGFGIWDNKMYGTFSTIVGTFDYQNKETVTSNNGATGILLADGMIQYVSGNWGSATSITGGTSSATANVAGFVTPTYSIGDKVIWGGYSWTNVNGNVGASTDVLNLNAEWSKNVYDTTNYNLAYDLIEYDYANDMIIRRHDLISNIDVRFDKETAGIFTNFYSIPFNAISVQQFGNPFNPAAGKGVSNKLINNGYDESINFCGSYQTNLTFGNNSYQINLTFGNSSSQTNLTFGSYSYQENLTFGNSSSQTKLTFKNNSYQENLTFGNSSSQTNLTFKNNSYQENLTFGNSSYQENLTFGNNSYQENLTFGNNSRQSNLTFGNNSNQYNLTFGNSSYQENLTFGNNSYQTNLTFGSGSNQSNLTFGNNSYQTNLTFGQNSSQNNLTFGENSQVDFNNQTLNSNMEYVDFKTKGFTVPNLSSATYIFDGKIKEVYQRPDGVIKLKFMNNSDVLEVHGIAD